MFVDTGGFGCIWLFLGIAIVFKRKLGKKSSVEKWASQNVYDGRYRSIPQAFNHNFLRPSSLGKLK